MTVPNAQFTKKAHAIPREGLAGIPISKNISFTFCAVLADVSIKNRLFESAYACEKIANARFVT
jgi:hypothetical protein